MINDRKLVQSEVKVIHTNFFDEYPWNPHLHAKIGITQNRMLDVMPLEDGAGAEMKIKLEGGLQHVFQIDVVRDSIPSNIPLLFAIRDVNMNILVSQEVNESRFVYQQFTPSVTAYYIITVTQNTAVSPVQSFYLDNFYIYALPASGQDFVSLYLPDVLSHNDYYPFGMQVPNRFASLEDYRYGFQGQEKDDEIKGEGNSLNYTFRMHDPRVGRFFAVDPLFKEYPELTPYQFSSNSPIDMVEIEGLEGGWIVEKGKALYRGGPLTEVFDSEEQARNAASRGIKTPTELRKIDKAWQQFLSRAPKVQRPIETVRCNCATCVMNSNNQVFLGGQNSIGGGIGIGIQEVTTDAALGGVVKKLGDGYEVFKAYKNSKLAQRSVTGGVEIISEGKSGMGLSKLADELNPSGSRANCVLVSIEFQKKLLKKVYTSATSTGGRGLNYDKMMEYLYANFSSVNMFRSPNGLHKSLIETLNAKITSSNSSIIIGKFYNATGEVTDHAFNAIKNSDGSWKFIDAQTGVEYTKAGMEKTFSSYKIIEVK